MNGGRYGSRERYRVATPPPERPLLLFDGDCGFCRFWVERWKRATAGRVDYAPAQQEAGRFPEIPADVFAGAVLLVEPDGEVFTGAEAVFRALAKVKTRGLPLTVYERVPGAALIADRFYALVAGHRSFFSRLTRLVWGRDPAPPTFSIARGLFLRLLGAVYLIAFVSLWVQIDGLVGARGIEPAARYLDAVRAHTGPSRFWLVPTLAWIAPGDAVLHFLCGAGAVVSALLIFGLLPAPCLALAWLFYLSLDSVCDPFLGFQWDSLLLETGLLAIFVAPLSVWCPLRRASRPPASFLFLIRWLVFRLMFSSGAVKLVSGDPTWRDLSALTYHYETQPLPPWTAWYAHHLPHGFQQVSTLVMFFIELAVPFAVFGPRRIRVLAFWILAGFQGLLIATGNFAFFNLLSIVLLVPLLDDSLWPARWRLAVEPRYLEALPSHRAGSVRPATRPRASVREWPRWVAAPIAALIFLASLVALGGSLRLPIARLPRLLRVDRVLAPLRSVNRYGLFAVMTTSRPEIIVEGSNDGRSWLAYDFRWKPGDLRRRPAFVAPHQPRLDWQMWFAALSDYRSEPWFMDFLGRLLEGSPPVLRLLARNPFPDAPPRYLRALVYDYHFTDAGAAPSGREWWRREPKGLYCPVVSLRGGARPE